jgi:hypothetical protein
VIELGLERPILSSRYSNSRRLGSVDAGSRPRVQANAGVRQLVIMSQTQGALLLVEVGLFVAAIWRIVSTLPGG